MVHRAGGTRFTLVAANAEAADRSFRIRGQAHSQSEESVGRSTRAIFPNTENRGFALVPPSVMGLPTIAISGGSPTMNSIGATSDTQWQQQPPPPGDYTYESSPDLPPIRHQPESRALRPLPGVAGLTTGMSPYSMPSPTHRSGPQPPHPHSICPDVFQQLGGRYQKQAASMYAGPNHNRLRRPGSPDQRLQESSYRRRRK